MGDRYVPSILPPLSFSSFSQKNPQPCVDSWSVEWARTPEKNTITVGLVTKCYNFMFPESNVSSVLLTDSFLCLKSSIPNDSFPHFYHVPQDLTASQMTTFPYTIHLHPISDLHQGHCHSSRFWSQKLRSFPVMFQVTSILATYNSYQFFPLNIF